MTLTLYEVKNTKDLRKFIRFPLTLYRNNPYYVPSLFPDEMNTLHWEKNPALEYCETRYWLAYDGNKIVGRIAAIINHKHIEKWGQSYIRFGWLDFVDDPQVSELLLSTVEAWAKERGLKAVHGPLGFTDLDREGMLVDGFEELATLATLYNYPYYPEHLTRLGYIKDTDWIEFELSVPEKMDERITRAAEIVLKRNNLHFLESGNKREMLKYAPQLFRLINDEYSHLYGSIPLSEREIVHYTNTYFSFVHPDFVPMVLNENNQLVAFAVVIPSLSKALQQGRGALLPFGWWYLLRSLKVNDRVDLYLIAVAKPFHGLGVNMVLMNCVYKALTSRGIRKAETNPELENNVNIQSQWKVIEKRQHKRRRCFIKELA